MGDAERFKFLCIGSGLNCGDGGVGGLNGLCDDVVGLSGHGFSIKKRDFVVLNSYSGMELIRKNIPAKR